MLIRTAGICVTNYINKGKNSKKKEKTKQNKENNHNQKNQEKKFITGNQNKELVHANPVKLQNVARKEDSDRPGYQSTPK